MTEQLPPGFTWEKDAPPQVTLEAPPESQDLPPGFTWEADLKEESPLETSADQSQGLVETGLEYGRRGVEAVREMWTGGGRFEEGIPELGVSGPSVSPFSPEGLKMSAAYITSTDPRQIADIAVKTLPGATVRDDKWGNPIVKFEGKEYYPNRPGASFADLFQFFPRAAVDLIAARLGARGTTLPRRMAMTGAGMGATSAGLDVAAEALGSEQGVSVERAATAAGAGALFEGLAPVAKRLWTGIFRRNVNFDPRTGRLTEAGKKKAKEAGLNPDDMDERLSKAFAREADIAADPRDAGARIAGEEFDVPMSRGQAQNIPGASAKAERQLAWEEQARNGAYGEKARRIMREFDDAQAEKMAAARGGVQERIGPEGQLITREGEAGEMVGEGLRSAKKYWDDAVDAAYTKANMVEARIGTEHLGALLKTVAKSMEDYGLDKVLHPAASRAMKEIKELATITSKTPQLTKLTLRRLETTRRRLRTYINSSANDGDMGAAINIKRSLDDWLDNATDNALFEGDERALDALKVARATRTKKGELLEQRGKGDEAGRVIEKILDTNPTPEQTINYIFGRGKLEGAHKAAPIIDRLGDALGRDSAEFASIQEAGWLRLAKEAGEKGFSPAKFKRNFDRAMEKNRTLMDTLYEPDDLALFRRFRDTVTKTITPDIAKNPSRSAYVMTRILQDYAKRASWFMIARGETVPGLALRMVGGDMPTLSAQAAKKALKPLSAGVRAPGAVAAGTAATVLEEE